LILGGLSCNAAQRDAAQRNATQRNATQRSATQRNSTQLNSTQLNATQLNTRFSVSFRKTPVLFFRGLIFLRKTFSRSYFPFHPAFNLFRSFQNIRRSFGFRMFLQQQSLLDYFARFPFSPRIRPP
jgi:hypothetical protein